MNRYLFSLFFVLSLNAHAIVTTELGFLYLTDALSSTNNSTQSKTLYDFSILMTSEGKHAFGIGWTYAGVSTSDETSTSTTYGSTETGPKFSYLFGRDKNWYLGLIYNFTATAKFKDANGEAEWRGTSYKAEFGFMPRITTKFSVGIKFNYHSANYNEQVTNSTTLTKTTNTKTMIYPTLSMLYDF